MEHPNFALILESRYEAERQARLKRLEKDVGIAMKEADKNYNPKEWSPCPEKCSECTTGNLYRPHPEQTRLRDNMTAIDFIKQYLPKQSQ